MMPIDLPQLRELSRAEKILLVQQLWDEIAAEPDQFTGPSWHDAALAESAAEYAANPREGIAWDEVKRRVQQKLK
jgi:putative addiction module component (TIGR02574 family)